MTGGATQTTKQSTTPGAFIQPSVDKLLNEANKSLATPKQYFPGSTVAGFDPRQVQGFGMVSDAAQGVLPQLAQGSAGALNSAFTLATDPGSDPIVQRQIQAVINPIQEQLQQSILPSIRQNAISAGNFGSDRQGFAEGRAVNDFIRTAGDVSNNVLATARGQGLQALGLLPQVTQAQVAPGTTLSNVGQQYQNLNQSQIADEVARFNFGQNEQDQRINQFANIVRGILPSATDTTQTQQIKGSPLDALIAGGLLLTPGGPLAGLLSGGGAALAGGALAGGGGLSAGFYPQPFQTYNFTPNLNNLHL